MTLPEVTRDALLEAMAKFDQELRDSEYLNWQELFPKCTRNSYHKWRRLSRKRSKATGRIVFNLTDSARARLHWFERISA